MASRPEQPASSASTGKKLPSTTVGGKKDFTTEYPMVDLEESFRLVLQIHEKGLEMASMPDVAKGCGYSSPTSTPFYKKMLAARMFKLLTPQKATLSGLAMDYFKPNQEDGAAKALIQAVHSVPAYADILQKNIGKKLNPEIIANGFARTSSLSNSCATLCARIFIASVKFAGLLEVDGTITAGKNAEAGGTAQSGIQNDQSPLPPPPASNNSAAQSYTLILDAARKVVITAPPEISKKELIRISKWLEFQLIVTDEEAPQLP